MLALAAVAFVTAGTATWYWAWWWVEEHNMPAAVLAEMHDLERTRPNDPRLMQIYTQYFSFPTDRADLLILVVLSTTTVPFVAWFGILAARRLSRPLSEVAQAAMDVAAGRFTVRLEPVPGAPAELKHLASSFNVMAERLQRYERELHNSSAAIAHELRTPLTAAKARLQGMLDGVFAREPAQLQKVMHQLDSLGQLVADLLTYSIVLAGKFEFALTEFALRELVQERCDWVLPQLQAEGIAIHNAVEKNLLVRADRQRLGQVISILVDNALRYAASGRMIEFHAAVLSESVQLRVVDRGPGIAREHLARVFERFWRAESSRSRHAGGSGLGLAIAAAICEAHGGSITAAQRQGGGGTEMIVTLPITPAISARSDST